MIPIRTLLSAVILIASGFVATEPISAQSPRPTRLGSEASIGELIRNRFTELQLVANDQEIHGQKTDSKGAEWDLGELDTDRGSSSDAGAEDDFTDDQGGDQPGAAEDRQRRESLIHRIAELKKPISQIKVVVAADGAIPESRAEQFAQREPMIAITALGVAPVGPNRYTQGFMHRPLYYEQRNLERCGQGFGCLQNGISGAQFLWNTMLLPYHIGRQRCDCLIPAGGDCLTGELLSIDCELCPLDPHGLTVQAAALAGFTFLLL